MFRLRSARLWGCLLAACVAGCSGSEQQPRARRQADISTEQRSLPVLFLMEKSRKEVILPANTTKLVDATGGERLWPAITCTNPDCPGKNKGTNDRPFLFICPDPTRPIRCPECLKIRDLESETDRQRMQYAAWARPYVLPETAARMRRLAAERKCRIAELRQLEKRRKRKPDR